MMSISPRASNRMNPVEGPSAPGSRPALLRLPIWQSLALLLGLILLWCWLVDMLLHGVGLNSQTVSRSGLLMLRALGFSLLVVALVGFGLRGWSRIESRALDLAAGQRDAATHGATPESTASKAIPVPSKSQLATRAVESRWQCYLDHALDAFLVLNPAGVIREVNQQASLNLGFTREELTGKSLLEFDLELTPARMEELLLRLQKDEVVQLETQHKRKDGSLFPVEIRFRGFQANNDWHVIAFAHDLTRRKQAEIELRNTLERYRSLVTAMSEGIVFQAADGAIQQCNASAQRILGLTEDQLCARASIDPIWRCVYEDGSPFPGQDHPSMVTLRTGQGCHNVIMGVEKPDGGFGWITVNTEPMFHPGEERPYGVVCSFSDITERKRADQALKESEQRLRVALRAAGAIAFVWDIARDSVQRYFSTEPALPANPKHAERLEDIRRRIHPDDRDSFDAVLGECLATGGEYCNLYRVVREDGTEVWLEDYGHLERGTDGTPLSLTGVSIDVTGRKKAEQAIRESEERFRAVAESLADPLYVHDIQGRLLYSNPSAARSLGYPPEEMAKLEILDLDSYFTKEAVREIWDRRLQVPHELTSFETTHRRKDGSTFPVEICLAVVPWREEQAFLATARDLTERKRAEQAIRESEERFRALVEYGYEGINILNTKGWSVYSSPRNASLVGLAEGEIDDDAMSFVYPEDRPAMEEVLARVASQPERGEDHRFRLLRRSGGWFWVEAHIRNLIHHPAVRGIVVNWRDVTDRITAEAELRASEERYRRLVDVLPSAVYINENYRISFCNPACVKLFGANSPADLIGKSPLDLFTSDYHDTIRHRVELMRHTGEAAPSITHRIIRLDGKYRTVTVVATPISQGPTGAILVCLNDTTERERTTALLQSVLDSVGDAILTVDQNGTIRTVNPATKKSFGYPESELLGQNVEMLMPPQQRAESEGYISSYLRTGIPRVIGVGREVVAQRHDQSTFPAELTVSEFHLEGERHFTGVIRDITERKRLESQLRQSQKMEAIGRLAGGVAHDFNNLLTVINGYCDLLQMDLPVGDRRREFVAAIQDAGERATRLTQQLLAFSRKAIVEPKVLDLNELISQSAMLLRRLIGEDIVFAVLTDPSLGRIKADPGQLEQVIMNLAVNARDAMPQGGRLTLETKDLRLTRAELQMAQNLRAGRYAQFRVTDTGAGMSEQVKANIFEPFFTTKPVGKGTGLGLAVVHGVIEQCGGMIEVESTEGVGTSFTITLPVVDESPLDANSGILRVAALGTETILLVEDEDAVRQIARLALEMQGYQVLEAQSAAEASRIASTETGPIHLLVSDVVMPEVGGRQLLESLRKVRPELHVLFMSGYTDDAIVLHGVVEANDAFIQKPFTPLGLARKVRAVLDSST